MHGDQSNDQFDSPVDPRIKISALWISMLFVFAYVDIFSLYKPGILGDLQTGTIYRFDITQMFLLLTTLFIVIPSLMVFFSLVMPPRLNRITNTVIAGVYTVIVVGNAVGEWAYYILGSAIEAALLLGIIYYARRLGSSPEPA